MMSRALLWVSALGTIGLSITSVLGYLRDPRVFGINTHASIALAGSLLVLFAHCWILFFLVGTGKAVREAVEEYDLDRNYIERTKAFKQELYPWLMLAMGLVIAAFVIGGGSYIGAMRPLWHRLLGPATVLVQFWTLFLEYKILAKNESLMRRVDREARATETRATEIRGTEA